MDQELLNALRQVFREELRDELQKELDPIKERLDAVVEQLDRMERAQAEDVVAMLGHLNNKLEVIRHDVEFVAKEQGAIRLEIDRSKRYVASHILHEKP
ncbi:hypothetical protein [Cohnella sp. 56]|uniref:hypothetical protein n=1 Tax=Cohnella sp. 56 TaxID=3113722 RepID=UPI0030E7D0D8